MAGAAVRAHAREQLVASSVQALHEKRQRAANTDAHDRQGRSARIASETAQRVGPRGAHYVPLNACTGCSRLARSAGHVAASSEVTQTAPIARTTSTALRAG